MSGGAFDYVYLKVTDTDYIHESLGALAEVEDYLNAVKRKEVADVIRDFRKQISDALYGAADRGKQLAGLLYTIERAASFDSDVSDIDKAFTEYLFNLSKGEPEVVKTEQHSVKFHIDMNLESTLSASDHAALHTFLDKRLGEITEELQREVDSKLKIIKPTDEGDA